MIKLVKIASNIIWILFTGIEMAITFIAIGCGWCTTIVGIPFGLQCFKFAKLAIFAKTRSIKTDFRSNKILNIIWVLLSGWFFALLFAALGVMWLITIIGFGKSKICFKFVILSLMPFGASVSAN